MLFYIGPQLTFFHRPPWKRKGFSTKGLKTTGSAVFPQDFSPLSTPSVEKRSQAGIDIRGNVPDVILQGGIAVFQRDLHFADTVKNGGVVPAKFLADIRQA